MCRKCYKRQPDQRAASLAYERAGYERRNAKRRERWASDPAYAEAQRHRTNAASTARYAGDMEWRAARNAASTVYRAQPDVAQRLKEQNKMYHKERQQDPVYRKARSYSARRRNTGYTPELFERLWETQNGCCAICRRSLQLGSHAALSVAADHCETVAGVLVQNGTPGSTKHPRGLLCSICNQALGMYEWHLRDNGVEVPAFARYLRETMANVLTSPGEDG